MPSPNNAARTVWAGAALLLAGARPAAPQIALFPRVRSFEYPIAHARPAGIYGRLLSLGRGESRYGAESEAEAGIGETLPLLALGQGRVPVTIGVGVGVSARFSLDDPQSALVSSDWVAGIHAIADAGPWRLALHFYHESSHLGDEYADRFDARRLDWTREVAALWASRGLGDFTVHGNLSYTLVDELALRRQSAAAGVDYRGRTGRLLGTGVSPVAGLFVEAAAFANWKLTTTGRAGVELGAGDRRLAVSLVVLDGLSSQRQFYRERSRYIGFELRFDL
jgi:hypothetical protein